MPKESTLRSMVLCLSLVCLVCSALLGGVYVMTKGKIDQEQIKKTNNAIALVTPEFDNAPSSEKMTVEIDGKEVAVYPARKDGQAVGYAVESFTSKGFSGTINIMVVCRQESGFFQAQRGQGRRGRGRHHGLHHYLQGLLRCGGQGLEGISEDYGQQLKIAEYE